MSTTWPRRLVESSTDPIRARLRKRFLDQRDLEQTECGNMAATDKPKVVARFWKFERGKKAKYKKVIHPSDKTDKKGEEKK